MKINEHPCLDQLPSTPDDQVLVCRRTDWVQQYGMEDSPDGGLSHYYPDRDGAEPAFAERGEPAMAPPADDEQVAQRVATITLIYEIQATLKMVETAFARQPDWPLPDRAMECLMLAQAYLKRDAIRVH